MTPTKTAEATGERVVPARIPLPGDPEDALIDEACRDLRLPAFRERFVEIAGTARREQASYRHLLELLQIEVADREVRRQQRLVRAAKFPRAKRLEDFDFEKNPNVPPELIGELKNPAWVAEGRPLVLIGGSGTGKSHLLIGIGTAVAEAGLVRYTTTSALVNELAEADAAKRLSGVIARYSKVDLLRLDEFGYLDLDKKSAKLLLQIFTEREEHKATAVASNAPFSEWDKTFTDPRLCAAIADRLTFKGTLIQTGTESYRLKVTENDYRSTGRS
ncbi:IS21-like element helper ATPase IstB [Streptomyces sp. NPDC047079]|uniref:IS21-like element helper ATPase IstB n=1 Tax=Streptomyces sp. NPDC047079 TaxID=3154607 RepID=UPI0033F46747